MKRYSLPGLGHHTRRRHWRTAMATATRPALGTPLCDLLGITYPICQAGMGHVARSALAAAVSEAGGLGVLAAAQFTPPELRQEIRRGRDLTDKPLGVDILFATGRAAGGEAELFNDAVPGWAVVAAGGIADGRGLAAALALGAVGVWLGTRFIATPEAYGHVNYKNKIVSIDEEGTTVTRAASGKPCRLIRNNFTREWERREAEVLPFPIQAARVGRPASILARDQGDIDNGNAPCGQSAGLIRDVRPAGDVVRSL